MKRAPGRAVATCLGILVGSCTLAGCPASDDGQAFLFNETGETGLKMVVHRIDEQVLESGLLDQAYSFDLQYVDGEYPCYGEVEGYFEVLRADGSVFVHHDFAARQVCERDKISLEPDGELVWSK